MILAVPSETFIMYVVGHTERFSSAWLSRPEFGIACLLDLRHWQVHTSFLYASLSHMQCWLRSWQRLGLKFFALEFQTIHDLGCGG